MPPHRSARAPIDSSFVHYYYYHPSSLLLLVFRGKESRNKFKKPGAGMKKGTIRTRQDGGKREAPHTHVPISINYFYSAAAFYDYNKLPTLSIIISGQ
jgi:hypothetical protein